LGDSPRCHANKSEPSTSPSSLKSAEKMTGSGKLATRKPMSPNSPAALGVARFAWWAPSSLQVG
jgi:hypothetical protein